MKYRCLIPFLLIELFALSCTKKDEITTRQTGFLPVMSGWQRSEAPKIYTHDNLFDYIDGNCELYFSYGFESLVSATYQSENNPNQTVTLDIYDMGTPLGAFGVYSSQAHPDYSFKPIGCEAIVSAQQIRFWQDRFEVEINSGDSIADAEKLLSEIAQRVSEKLPACQPLAAMNWLPQQQQVPHTLKYVAEGFLGQDYLPGGLEATYQINGLEVRGFVAKCENADRAEFCLRKYTDAQRGFEGAEVRDKGSYFESFHEYTGHVWAGCEGPWFFGATSAASAEDCRKIAEAIGRNLQMIKTVE
ncbi:MAG: hypothetical protein ONB44_06755 [candidate division KSB1 bacterium]|nr:hypothetical protein [candidate division KSB1 bacterium]MDZ7301823.1 hypothetical protein [candidate division KSB1 bacterium]MDZ7314151.1 hypothetical protein [candidate division KSB1 bacterium]